MSPLEPISKRAGRRPLLRRIEDMTTRMVDFKERPQHRDIIALLRDLAIRYPRKNFPADIRVAVRNMEAIRTAISVGDEFSRLPKVVSRAAGKRRKGRTLRRRP